MTEKNNETSFPRHVSFFVNKFLSSILVTVPENADDVVNDLAEEQDNVG